MRINGWIRMVVGLALLGGARLVAADVPKTESPAAASQTVVVVSAVQGVWNCGEATRERARWLADKASREGAYQRAGECYLAAGEQALADRAFVRAVSQTGAQASRDLAANVDEAKAQARQLKLAFRRR